jgi:nicotinate-nucleotide--dimethylbenzimidazole phosphoribosyltransferase
MKMVLTGLKRLEIKESTKPRPMDGFRRLRVSYCAVCRTDAKMWNEGHRDLVFPRVPGHELVGRDESGKRFTVWPGTACGVCRYCTGGRENLCEEMKIMGFHNDGGFADYLLAPEKSLVPVPDAVPSHMACFAEPVGCALNALGKLHLKPAERIIIYGGGTLGLIIALICRQMGAVPLIIEKNEEKIARADDFLSITGIQCVKDTTDSAFDAAINACPDYIAFCLSMVKLGKAGRFSFFSGLAKNEHIETNLINLMHYKETALYGSYGLTKKNMIDALAVIQNNGPALETLVEKIVVPQDAPALMPRVLAGKALKYILDFGNSRSPGEISGRVPQSRNLKRPIKERFPVSAKAVILNEKCQSVVNLIRPVREDFRPAAQSRIDDKAKPLGALGTLEDLAVQMSMIQENPIPRIHRKSLFVFAADHGVAEEGVSAYPAEVTGQMVKNFLAGGAAINVLCRHHDIDLRVVDMGVNGDLPDHVKLIKKKVRKGTRNFALEPAMTADEALLAIESGMAVFLAEYDRQKIDIVGLGEMGIANTTSASAIISTVADITPAQVAGRGTGVDDKGLAHKIEVIEKSLSFHRPDPNDGLDVLCKVGGYELAGIAGMVLAAASRKTAVVLDGVISTAAGLIAWLINPDVGGYLIAGHRSVEVAQIAALKCLGLTPVIDFKMRLGEGTGAAMTIDTVTAACRIMAEMASFDEAGISKND